MRKPILLEGVSKNQNYPPLLLSKMPTEAQTVADGPLRILQEPHAAQPERATGEAVLLEALPEALLG